MTVEVPNYGNSKFRNTGLNGSETLLTSFTFITWSWSVSPAGDVMQDCSATPEACLKVRCTITPLLGLARNEAKISLRGFVDERFFFVSSVPLSVAPLVGLVHCW